MKTIKLSSSDATSYWWILTLRNKVNNIFNYGTNNYFEKKFASIFSRYTERDWRFLYLKIRQSINSNLFNFIPLNKNDCLDMFNQGTDKGSHDIINNVLSDVTKTNVPDIRLALNWEKDSVIYTNYENAYIYCKSSGVSNLSLEYKSCYILTGNEEELDFYNLLLSTIYMLKKFYNDFNSIDDLRTGFCEQYIKNNTNINKDSAVELFNHSYDIACDRNIIVGKYWEKEYYTDFKDRDLIGLGDYFDTAKEYAKGIIRNNNHKVLKKEI